MTAAITLTNEIIAQAESYDGISAGVVHIKDVMDGRSYKAMNEGQRSTNTFERGSMATGL